jgi:hypothetical protein
MESEQRVPLDEAGKRMLASVNKMLITEAVEKLDTAANNEMELHGVSVLWSKITRAKGILKEAQALEDQPS